MHSILQSMIGQLQAVTPPGPCVPIEEADKTIGTGTSTVSFLPAYGLWDYSWGAMIWDAAEMDGAKQITGVEFNHTGFTGGYTYLDQRIFVAHVEESEFSALPMVDLSDLTITDLTECKESFTNTLLSPAGFKRFDFDTNFCYNGTSNLILVWENRDGSWASGFGSTRFTVATNKAAYKYQDDEYPFGVGENSSARPNIKFQY